MSLLAPLMLAALAALAVPILLHLTERERKQVVIFPSLSFLRRVPYRSVRRHRIRHWPLLALRLLVLALLALAFARPFFTAGAAAIGAGPAAREVVILVDRSASMGHADRWSRALDAARQAVRGLGRADRATVIAFSDEVEFRARSAADPAAALAAIESLDVDTGATRPGPALKLAAGVLTESSLPGRVLVVVSDFQRSGWANLEPLVVPPGTEVTPVTVGDDAAANLAIANVTFARAVFERQERVTVSASVFNHGGEPRTIDVALEIGGRARGSASTELPARSGGVVSFEPFTLDTPEARGRLTLEDDGLQADNAFHFTVPAVRPVPVTILEATPSASTYLSRALAIGHAPGFSVTRRAIDQGGAIDIGSNGVVIVNDAPVSVAVARRLRAHVTEGGGLWVVAGDRIRWPEDDRDLLPALPGETVDRGARGSVIGDLDGRHPVFELFRAPGQGDFRPSRYYRTRQLGAPSGTVIARFEDGAPALVEKTVGAGRVMLWASTLDRTWTDLALRPVFLPFVHRTVLHLARYRPPQAWIAVGAPLALGDELVARRPGLDLGAVLPTVRVLDPTGRPAQVDETDDPVVTLRALGFHELRFRLGTTDESTTIAVVPEAAESDLGAMDPAEAVAAAVGAEAGPAPEVEAALTPEARERQQGVWAYLLAAVLALLVAETMVAAQSRV